MWPRRTRFAGRHRPRRLLDRNCASVGNQPEADLTSTGELNIDLREQLRVEQRAVLHAVATVDAETHAQSVEAVLGAGMARAGERQRVDHPMQADRRPAAAFELIIEEAEVEARIVRDQRRILDEREQL